MNTNQSRVIRAHSCHSWRIFLSSFLPWRPWRLGVHIVFSARYTFPAAVAGWRLRGAGAAVGFISASTVVWNPWTAKAKAMADFGDDEWPGMLCIETANAADNTVTLAPGARHTMRATVAVA